MKYIIAGTNRPGSRTLMIANLVQEFYREAGEEVEIIDLAKLPLNYEVPKGYGGPHPKPIDGLIEKINRADGLVVVCPEYNGSFPGALKFFIDHWVYPESFEFRPVCFVGLGGKFGGLRPVEHLQQVFGYRNAYIFPVRVFLFNVWDALKDGRLQDEGMVKMLRDQVTGFQKFTSALDSAGLSANSRQKTK